MSGRFLKEFDMSWGRFKYKSIVTASTKGAAAMKRAHHQRMSHLLFVAVLLGGTCSVAQDLVLANDGGAPGADQKSSSGMALTHPIGNDKLGEELYHASCAVCHGPRASGNIGPPLAGNPILSNDKAFWQTVFEGRHVMPPLQGLLTEQQIAHIQAWLKTLP
jgi:cytochrome c553